MARPMILAIDYDQQVLRAHSGEKALDILGRLELRGDPHTLDFNRARHASSPACR
jgi:hypothetical protein